ncbi:MAG: hypothetical protein ACR2PM_01150 [Hyphomicrobiales bacterium]
MSAQVLLSGQTPVAAALEPGCGSHDLSDAAIILAQSTDADGANGVSEAEATESVTEEAAPDDNQAENQTDAPEAEKDAVAGEDEEVSDAAAIEVVFWQSVKDSEDIREFEEYLKQFPDGTFAGLARIKINKLKKAAAAPKPAETGQTDTEQAEKEPTEVPPAPEQDTASDTDTDTDTDQAAASADGAEDAAAVAQDDSPPVQLCDRIAGHPEDELRRAKGVHLELMAAERGKTACRKALKSYPDEPRFIYQMGRSYAAAKEYADAKEWFERAADLGYPMAAVNIGEFNFEGWGYPKDSKQAARWYLKGAELGSARGHYLYGDLLDLGVGVERDPERAARYILDAIRKGNKSSIYQMRQNAEEWSPEFRKALQVLMRDAGVYDGDIDGAFGRQTRRAVALLAQGRGS